MQWVYLIIAVTAEVIATSFLKASDGFSRLLPALVVVTGYATAFYFLSLTLKTIPIGIAYALWSGIGVVLITLVAWVVYEQSLDIAAIIGIALVVSGAVVINLFSKSMVH